MRNKALLGHSSSHRDPSLTRHRTLQRLTLVLHHSVMHSQQKRCPQGVQVECLLSSRQRMQLAAAGPEVCAR